MVRSLKEKIRVTNDFKNPEEILHFVRTRERYVKIARGHRYMSQDSCEKK